MTSQKQTSLFTEEPLIFSQGDSLANHTAKQEKDLERKMTDISGQKCLEQYKKFPQVTLWGKTFLELLIGTGDWFSTRCKLIWRLRGTKYNRLYCQLVPLELYTEETGLGLLPTPNTTGLDGGSNSRKANKRRLQLLPTPLTNDYKRAVINLDKNTNYLLTHQMTLHEVLLHNSIKPSEVVETYQKMMGFPNNWTGLPFQNGKKKASKHTETPSSRKSRTKSLKQ